MEVDVEKRKKELEEEFKSLAERRGQMLQQVRLVEERLIEIRGILKEFESSIKPKEKKKGD